MSMKAPTTLLNLRNFLYARAGMKWTWSVCLSFAALLLTILGLWTNRPFLIACIGVGSVALPILVTWIRESASDDMLKGDKCRRLILLSDGLGQPIPPSQIAEVRSWVLGAAILPSAFVPPYYLSSLPAGPQRLADNLTESAFFTKALAAKCSYGFWIACGTAAVAARRGAASGRSLAERSTRIEPRNCEDYWRLHRLCHLGGLCSAGKEVR